MTEEEKLEIAKRILNNAADINISKETLLKISQKTDQFIVNYLKQNLQDDKIKL